MYKQFVILVGIMLISCNSLSYANPDGVVIPSGDLRIKGAGSGLVFPDGSIQYKATVEGPQGPQGQTGMTGLQGQPGPMGPAGTIESTTDVSVVLPGTWYVTNYPQSGSMTTSQITFIADGTYNIANGMIPLTGTSDSPSEGKWAVRQSNIIQIRNNSSLISVFPLVLSYTSGQIILERFGNIAVLTKSQYSAPFTISGRVTDTNGTPVQSVSLSLNNNLGYAITDSNGNYTISGLGLFSGNYTLTPSLAGSTLSPNTRSILVSGDNMPNLNFTSSITPIRDVSNVTDYTKLKSTIINVNGLVNNIITSNNSYSDSLYNLNMIDLAVPVQNYFGSDSSYGVVSAKIVAHTIKYSFPVQASATRTPYDLVYTELSSTGSSLSSLRISFIPTGSCSNANDINNPTSECVSYSYSIIDSSGSLSQSAGGSLNLVKSPAGNLTLFQLPK